MELASVLQELPIQPSVTVNRSVVDQSGINALVVQRNATKLELLVLVRLRNSKLRPILAETFDGGNELTWFLGNYQAFEIQFEGELKTVSLTSYRKNAWEEPALAQPVDVKGDPIQAREIRLR